MPLQGILYDEAGRRTQRVHAKELVGFPVGQIVGRMNKVRPAATSCSRWSRSGSRRPQKLSAMLGDDA